MIQLASDPFFDAPWAGKLINRKFLGAENLKEHCDVVNVSHLKKKDYDIMYIGNAINASTRNNFIKSYIDEVIQSNKIHMLNHYCFAKL